MPLDPALSASPPEMMLSIVFFRCGVVIKQPDSFSLRRSAEGWSEAIALS